MWQLENRTPFVAERDWVRDENGSENWIVVVKGTISLRNNQIAEIAKEQVDICHEPQYFGRPGFSSLLYDSDIAFEKNATDILVRGHAYPERGSSARETSVTLSLGSVRKTLRILGDRHWEKGLIGIRSSEALKFEKVPLLYERAFGGTIRSKSTDLIEDFYSQNPAGTGYSTDRTQLIGVPLPNIEYPDEMVSSWDQRPKPAGLLPIALSWSPRVDFAGTYDKTWERERQPLYAYDFDRRFFQCAPQDQQNQGYLVGGELVELINLSPYGSLTFLLPKIELKFVTRFGSSPIEHKATLQTVIFEPDIPRLLMVWLARLNCHKQVYKLRDTTVTLRRFSA